MIDRRFSYPADGTLSSQTTYNNATDIDIAWREEYAFQKDLRASKKAAQEHEKVGRKARQWAYV